MTNRCVLYGAATIFNFKRIISTTISGVPAGFLEVRWTELVRVGERRRMWESDRVLKVRSKRWHRMPGDEGTAQGAGSEGQRMARGGGC
eukprot:6204251-Pleurochrysis_carterae.AAC.3